jgi:hypothetical protein
MVGRSLDMTRWSELPRTRGVRAADLNAWIGDAHSCVDPYWLLAEATAFRAFSRAAAQPGRRIPVLLEVSGEPETKLPCDIVVEDVNKPLRFVAAWVERSQLAELIDAVKSGSIKRFQLGAPRTANTGPVSIVRKQGALSPNVVVTPAATRRDRSEPTTYLGIVDDGFPFAHPNFLRQDRATGALKTRVLSVWDQTERTAPKAGWTRPKDGGLGDELSAGAIDDAIATARVACKDSLSALEQTVYRLKEYKTSPLQPAAFHGSGVMHLMAGNSVALPDRSRGEAHRKQTPQIICVQLPDDHTLEDTAGGWLGFYALLGIHHIVKSVVEQAQGPWHAVINLSYGSIAGPHDGTSMFEQAMAEIAGPFDTSIGGEVDLVLAAGNTRGKNVHAQRTIEPGACGTFRIFVPPDNPRESYLELWIPTPAVARDMRVDLVAPDGDTATLRVGEAAAFVLDGAIGPCAGVAFSHRVSQGMNGTMVLLLVRPTQIDAKIPDRAPAGIWEMRVHNDSLDTTTFHAWVERNDMIGQRRRVQQARFVPDPNDKNDPPHVNDELTLSSAAGGDNVTVVGAIRQCDGVVADYSGCDTRRAGSIPQYFAASDVGPATPGIQIPGFYSGVTTRMSGTSIAAPWVARCIASGDVAPRRAQTYSSLEEMMDQVGPPTYRTVRSDEPLV